MKNYTNPKIEIVEIKSCDELFENGYVDRTQPALFGNTLGRIRYSEYLPDKKVCEIIMRLRQFYNVNYYKAEYYLREAYR